ncbi:MAG: Holliday junction branch migration protein RuvA [Christensenellales bacterium]|jgi:Holliday junction DNA helicase RuvA
MYAYIQGIIESIGEGVIVISNNGIGYSINVSSNCLVKLGGKGDTVKVHTYMHVREDEISLFGFYSLDEKAMFLKLINVSGIGPKLALGVLSGIDLQSLINIIMTGDIKALSTIKGVGKKTAERIVLELRGSIEDVSAAAPVRIDNDNINDAVLALVNLGISRNEAYNAVMKASADTEDTSRLVAEALRSLYR